MNTRRRCITPSSRNPTGPYQINSVSSTTRSHTHPRRSPRPFPRAPTTSASRGATPGGSPEHRTTSAPACALRSPSSAQPQLGLESQAPPRNRKPHATPPYPISFEFRGFWPVRRTCPVGRVAFCPTRAIKLPRSFFALQGEKTAREFLRPLGRRNCEADFSPLGNGASSFDANEGRTVQRENRWRLVTGP